MEENRVEAEVPELEAPEVAVSSTEEVIRKIDDAIREARAAVAAVEAETLVVEAAKVEVLTPVEVAMVAVKCVVNEVSDIIKLITTTKSVEDVTFINLMACLPDLSMSGQPAPEAEL